MFIFTEREGRFFVEQLGAFGSSPFGDPQTIGSVPDLWEHLRKIYPYSPANFYTRAGLEGPQTVISWEPPAKPIARFILRRKLREFPVDPSDGILIADETENANLITSISDCAANNLMTVLEKSYDIPRDAVNFDQSLFDIFDQDNDGAIDEAQLAAFFNEYEQRFAVTLDPTVKTKETLFKDVVLEAQKHELMQGTQVSGTNWWYYRLFVQPDLPAIASQFAGEGTQNLESISYVGQTLTLGSTILDVQEFRNLQLLVENSTAADINIECYTLPELNTPTQTRLTSVPAAGLAVPFSQVNNVGAGTTASVHLTDMSFKHIVLVVTTVRAQADLGEEFVRATFIVNRLVHFQSNSYLSKACLAYKTGDMQEIVWDRSAIPTVFTRLDEDPTRIDQQVLSAEEVTRLSAQERINLNDVNETKGPLYRFLKMFTLELDRNSRYLQALSDFNSDILNAPKEVLAHIAYELGWEVDLDRPLMDIRMELLNLAGMYKTKGTAALYEALGAQQTNIFPRVQEGQGIVARAADPIIFDGGIAQAYEGPFYVQTSGPAILNRTALSELEDNGFFYPLFITPRAAGGEGNFHLVTFPEHPGEEFYSPKLQLVKAARVRPETVTIEFSAAYSLREVPTSAGPLSSQGVQVVSDSLNVAGIASGDVT